MGRKSTYPVQIKGHCSSCGEEAKINPSHVGRPHKKHLPHKAGRWVSGPAPVPPGGSVA